MTELVIEIVRPDADGYLPNGWVDSYPHNDGEHPCFLQCCEPDAYPRPTVWQCQNEDCYKKIGSLFAVKLRHPGECINCSPLQSTG